MSLSFVIDNVPVKVLFFSCVLIFFTKSKIVMTPTLTRKHYAPIYIQRISVKLITVEMIKLDFTKMRKG